MSIVNEVLGSMRDVLLMADKVDRAGMVLSELSRELRDHDNRLVRLETIIETNKKHSR